MKAAELNKMSAEELNAKLKELKGELFNLRFQHAINQLDNPHKLVEVKEDIARMKKMGVPNLPSVYINGKMKFRSIIPSKDELEAAIREVM